jgi:hypothetical protein
MRSFHLALVLVTGTAFSQTAATPPDPPAADPARPTVTNPAHIPPPGYLQFEQGFVQAIDSPGLKQQFSIVQTTKLSLFHHFMVQAADQPIAHSTITPGVTSIDTGDTILGAQVLFTDKEEGKSKIPTVALAFNRRVHSGTSPDLDVGSFSQGLTLLASGTIHLFHYDTNFIVNEQLGSSGPGPIIRRAQYGQTLSISRQLTEKASLTGELWHFTQPLVSSTRDGSPSPRSNAVGLVFAGGYAIRPNLVLDAGFDHGLTSTSTNWQAFAGFTYLLPIRLFPEHKTNH